jgi:hypothetical protein
MGWTGEYHAFLVCDECLKLPHGAPAPGFKRRDVFVGKCQAEAFQAARDAGWLLQPRGKRDNDHGAGRALCPKHTRANTRRRQEIQEPPNELCLCGARRHAHGIGFSDPLRCPGGKGHFQPEVSV